MIKFYSFARSKEKMEEKKQRKRIRRYSLPAAVKLNKNYEHFIAIPRCKIWRGEGIEKINQQKKLNKNLNLVWK